MFSLYRAYLKDSVLLDISAEGAEITDWRCRCQIKGERHACLVCLKLVHCDDWTPVNIHATPYLNSCAFRCPSCAEEHSTKEKLYGTMSSFSRIAENEGCQIPDQKKVDEWMRRRHQDPVLPALDKLRFPTQTQD